MSSKGQNQLLQAAIRNRQRLAEEQQQPSHDRELEVMPDSVTIVEQQEVGPIAGPITTTTEAARPIRSLELVSHPARVDTIKDDSAMSGPLVNAPRNKQIDKYKGNLLKHPTLETTLRKYFNKVQMGEDRVVVFGAMSSIEDTNTDGVFNFLTNLINAMDDFNGYVIRGNREGRYRILAQNKK